MNPGSAPHRGPALAPQREVSLEMDGITQPSIEVLPEEITTNPGPQEPLPPQLQTSPTPEDPEKAVKTSTLETRMGELIQALGRKQDEMSNKLEEQKLFYETQLAVATSAGPKPPAGFDPNKPVMAGEFYDILSKVEPYIKEQTIRSMWDVTDEEEQSILQANPHIAQIQDGAQKAEFIRRAANLLRKAKGSNGEVKTTPSTASSETESGRAANTRPIPSDRRVVPHIEGATTPMATDFSPEDPTEGIKAAYEAAKKIPDRTERLAAMKGVFRKAQRGAGISDEGLAKSSFSST